MNAVNLAPKSEFWSSVTKITVTSPRLCILRSVYFLWLNSLIASSTVDILGMSLWFLFMFLACVAHCFVQPRFPKLARSSSSPLCLKRSSEDLWMYLELARDQRERIKAEIIEVIDLQRGLKEDSKSYLELEQKFMELLDVEDETVLKISRLVNEIVGCSKLSRNVSSIYRAYFNDA